MTAPQTTELQSRCDLLRSLHRPGDPLLLRNAWDVATARAVVAALVAALRSVGAAGCNLEDTDHAAGSLRDPERHAEWLGAVRQAASDDGYELVINARIDVFLGPFLEGADPGTQGEPVPEALRRANAYLEAGVDCVFPITRFEDQLASLRSENGPRLASQPGHLADAT